MCIQPFQTRKDPNAHFLYSARGMNMKITKEAVEWSTVESKHNQNQLTEESNEGKEDAVVLET